MRWHQDSDRWVWRVYDGPELGTGAVSQKTGEDTTDTYIVPLAGVWWIVNAKLVTNEHKNDWIEMVKAGDEQVARVAGPFEKLDGAKAAWRLMYG